MKKDVSQTVIDLDGKPLVDDNRIPVTYAKLIGMFLIGSEATESSDSKWESFQLASKLTKANEVNFKPNEITLILEKAGKQGSVIAYGRLKEFFEGRSIE